MPLTPEVLWAQRSSGSELKRNFIYLTLSVSDVNKKDSKLEIQPNSITFSGYSSSLKSDYSVEIELYDEIIPDQCSTNWTGKNIQLILIKKELRQEYWPRLTKDKRKLQFIKTDFDKWVDEDEQNQPSEADSEYLGGMGGMPGLGDMSSMMGGAGGDLGGMDFSKLGGGMDEEDVDDDDEEDMPSLEGDEEKTSAATEVKDTNESTSKAKIQEVS